MANKTEIQMAELKGVLDTVMRILWLVFPGLLVGAGTIVYRHFQLESEMGRIRSTLESMSKSTSPQLVEVAADTIEEVASETSAP
jgi:hypothetical protein